jgi:hypothetical protein
MAAYDATLPAGCQRTIYLCDDGKVLHPLHAPQHALWCAGSQNGAW